MRSAVADAARFLVEHARERVTLGDVADAVSYSRFHLARTFAEEIRVPPGQFLAAQRFQRAKQLLLSGNDAVVEICREVGFASLGTFTTRFTAATGTTPAGFRHLPDLLVSSPPRPISVEGPAPRHGVVTGTVQLSPAASYLLGPGASVYVGLFPRRAAFSVRLPSCSRCSPSSERLSR